MKKRVAMPEAQLETDMKARKTVSAEDEEWLSVDLDGYSVQ